MIVFASSITEPETYERCAARGIRLAAEPDSEVIANAAAGSLSRAYNLILDTVAEREDLEALVLLHQDVEIVDADFCAKLRGALRDPLVGVVGCVGATGMRSMAWWDGSVARGAAVYRYGELGGGEASWTDGAAGTSEVETLYGLLLALSPWTVRNLRFDESLGPRYGYDFDLCRQVRAAGGKVVTESFRVAHHHSLNVIAQPEAWVAAHMQVAEKWDDAPEDDWKQRARRAEAEAAAARLLVASKQLQADALTKELAERLATVTDTPSWRITAPLRRVNGLLRRARARRPS